MFRSVALMSLLLACTALAAQQNNVANQQSEARKRQNQPDQSNDTKQARGSQNARAGRDGHSQGADHHFATCVAFGNQEEVILGQLAIEKAQSEEVKRFAEMMVKDHQQYLSKLQKFAPEAARQGALGSAGAARTNESDPNDASANTRAKTTQAGEGDKNGQNQARNAKREGAAGENRTEPDGSQSMMQVERELAEQCVKSARQKLESKTGADFDRCYMHAQVAKHGAMKDKLTVFQRHTSQELSQVFADGLKTTEQHLAQAEEIAKSLDQGGAAGSKSTGKARETRGSK